MWDLKNFMRIFEMKKLYYFIFMCTFYPGFSFAQSTTWNEKQFKSMGYEPVFNNKSILSCGKSPNLEIYSSFDFDILLSISNALSSVKVPLTTNWQNFTPPTFNSINLNEAQYKSLPGDVARVLYLTLTWNESQRLKLFLIPDAALENVATRLKNERPWQALDATTVKKADNLSQESLKEFIYIVLRANVFESTRGNFLDNKSLWFISWDWLVLSNETPS